MALLATMLALAAPAPAPEIDPERYGGCRSHKCVQRVRTKGWRRVTRPYSAWLRSTRMCESDGRYTINTGNGFFGAYQFTLSSWRAVGGWGFPHHARPIEQDYRAVRLLHVQGRGAWPVCG